MRLLTAAAILLLTALPAHAADKETAFERILRTGTIRCGYIIYPPQLMRDVNSGKISGFAADIIEHIASELSLKVEWAEETGTASMIDGLKSGRFDAVCNTVWASTVRTREAWFTDPVFFTAVNAYVREGDERFDNDISILNDPAYKIAVMDGSSSNMIATTDFPKANTVSLTELTDFTHLLLDVSSGKADITFSEKAQALAFLAANPGSIREVPTDRPVRLFANAYMIARGESALLEMLNTALMNARNNGIVDRAIDRHEIYPGSFYRVSMPYE